MKRLLVLIQLLLFFVLSLTGNVYSATTGLPMIDQEGNPPFSHADWEQIERQVATLSQVAKLTASDAQAEDTFGFAVAVSGDIAVAGATEEYGGPGDPLQYAGAAYVFERDEGGLNNWGQVAKLTASDAQADDFFGQAVAVSGDTVAVSAWNEDGGTGDPFTNSGAVYVFQRDEGGADNWGEVGKLTPGDPGMGDLFGNNLALNGDTLVVGSYREDGGTGDPLVNSGAAYIFERDEGGADNWGEVLKLTASDPQVGDQFGVGVDIHADTIAVGARDEDGGPGDPIAETGAAYIFERDEGGPENWGQVARVTASDPQADDAFGSEVAVNNQTVVVAAPKEDGGPGDPHEDAGAAYIFDRDEGGVDNWGQVARLQASDPQEFDEFGNDVAVSGNLVVVGSCCEDGGTGGLLEDAGAAYVFNRNEGGADNWGQVQKVTASDAGVEDYFGNSVSASGDTVVVGAYNESGGPGDPLNGAGAAYVFEQPPEYPYSVYLPLILRE